MDASDLHQALNLFDPRRPLEMDELAAYYVQRPHAPLESMKTYLRLSRRPVKVLFSGHRGSGKSTELRRLARDLEGDFFVVHAAARSLNLSDLSYVDVVLACSVALLRAATDRAREVRLPAGLERDTLNWLTKEITPETTIRSPKSGTIGGKLNLVLLTIERKYGQETETRTILRDRLVTRVNELIERVNLVCGEVAAMTGLTPLIVFEDIDKTDLAHARDLFFEHSTSLSSVRCHIIYTFPIALCYSNAFIQRLGDYSRHFLLPNINVNHVDNTPFSEGREALKEVVTRRVSARLFAGNALTEIVELSGGLIRDLVRLVADSALAALAARESEITSRVVKEVAASMANDFRRLLLPEHYAALRKARKTKQVTPDETIRQALENLSLLEYRNGTTWCDVHPLAWTLLDQP